MINTIKNPVVKEILDWTLHIAIAVLLALFIVNYVAQRTLVDGSSMLPTLQDKNQLIIEKITPRFGTLKRGDIVAIYVSEAHKDYIKRIIGVEGDNVEVKGGKVYVNGQELKESYINGDHTDAINPEYSKTTVPKGMIYVMGDNRLPNASDDSRSRGPMEIKKVVGKAVFRYWPFDKLGVLK